MIVDFDGLERYAGKWIAVVDGMVVASGDKGMDVYRIGRKYTDVPLIFQVPEMDDYYIFYDEDN